MNILKIILGILLGYLWQFEANKNLPDLKLKENKWYLIGIYLISILICLFSTRNNILPNTIFFFFIGLCAIQDSIAKEFQSIYLFAPLIFGLFYNFKKIIQPENLIFWSLFVLLLFYVLRKKLGSGDLWIIVIIFFNFGLNRLLIILLIACLIFLWQNFRFKNKPQPFVPALFYACILCFFL